MRKPFVAGNWKMNKTIAEARSLIAELVPGLQAISGVERVLCPPFLALQAAAAMLEGTGIGLGAQNVYWKLSGAFTGEVSPLMIAELCQYVIVGHSERRTYFHETDQTVNDKVREIMNHGVTPIVCVGETRDEYEAKRTAEVVSRQVQDGLAELSLSLTKEGMLSTLVIAYEPVWAIGTGLAATAEEANAVIADVIRPVMAERYGKNIAQAVRVLYGGSVNGDNAREFFMQPDIDGALVGGSSLKASDFIRIVQAAAPEAGV